MTPFIHQTDIFHPHGDPDDHWDLATVYALAARESLDLRGIMFDYPPDHRLGDPATLAAAQLGCLTGITGIPAVIGSMFPMRHRKDSQSDRGRAAIASAEWLCRALEASAHPVVINIVGSCTDVAVAGLMRPDLFQAKCKAIYLNAGAANPGKDGELEYNVRLNPSSYAAVFDLPCPVYWCPCWHQTEVREVGPNGTWYSFVQGEVLRHIGGPLCNYFLYMLSRSADPKYLRYLTAPVDPALLEDFGAKPRSMWSTAAILHAAGLGVDAKDGLQPAGLVADPVFEFLPITIACADDGQTTWKTTGRETGSHIFQIRHPDLYAAAMTAALGSLLKTIGKKSL
jgi:hypothetical protein